MSSNYSCPLSAWLSLSLNQTSWAYSRQKCPTNKWMNDKPLVSIWAVRVVVMYVFGTYEFVLLCCCCVALSVHMLIFSPARCTKVSSVTQTNVWISPSLSIILSQRAFVTWACGVKENKRTHCATQSPKCWRCSRMKLCVVCVCWGWGSVGAQELSLSVM